MRSAKRWLIVCWLFGAALALQAQSWYAITLAIESDPKGLVRQALALPPSWHKGLFMLRHDRSLYGLYWGRATKKEALADYLPSLVAYFPSAIIEPIDASYYRKRRIDLQRAMAVMRDEVATVRWVVAFYPCSTRFDEASKRRLDHIRQILQRHRHHGLVQVEIVAVKVSDLSGVRQKCRQSMDDLALMRGKVAAAYLLARE